MYTLDANIFLRDLNTNDPDYLECHALLAQLEATATPVIVPLVWLARSGAKWATQCVHGYS